MDDSVTTTSNGDWDTSSNNGMHLFDDSSSSLYSFFSSDNAEGSGTNFDDYEFGDNNHSNANDNTGQRTTTDERRWS